MKTKELTKSEIISDAQSKMDTHLLGDIRTSREKVALTCQILYASGHDSGLAGQITARLPHSEDRFLTQRLGLGFDEITAANLLEVNSDLEVIQGRGMANPANRFHSWIYERRPEVQCIIHTHPFYTSALSMLEEPLAVAHMDACMLYGDVAFLEKWPGIPVGNDEGEIISAALGGKRSILLAHHGLVVTGRSVEEACTIAVQFERAAKLHLCAAASGQIKPIPPDLAHEAHDWILTERRSIALFEYLVRKLDRSGQYQRAEQYFNVFSREPDKHMV